MPDSTIPQPQTQPQPKAIKPPIGLRPLKFALEDRMKEITDACDRYDAASKPIPDQWFTELMMVSSWLVDEMFREQGVNNNL